MKVDIAPSPLSNVAITEHLLAAALYNARQAQLGQDTPLKTWPEFTPTEQAFYTNAARTALRAIWPGGR